jgi:hypothetical protein
LALDTLKHRFIDFNNVDLQEVQKADYEFLVSFAYLNHFLSNLSHVAFFDAQDAENEFIWPFDIFKHRFIDFTKDVHKADYEFSGPFAYLKR